MFFQKQNCVRSQVYSLCKSIKSPSDVYDLVFVFLKSWDKYWVSDIFRDYREVEWVWNGLTLLWRGSLSYRNQSIDFSANQWTGFYIIGVSVMKELTTSSYSRLEICFLDLTLCSLVKNSIVGVVRNWSHREIYKIHTERS